MQYQRLTDETSTIVGETGESYFWSSSLNTDRNVRRIRKKILILLCIQLVSSIIFDGKLIEFFRVYALFF